MRLKLLNGNLHIALFIMRGIEGSDNTRLRPLLDGCRTISIIYRINNMATVFFNGGKLAAAIIFI